MQRQSKYTKAAQASFESAANKNKTYHISIRDKITTNLLDGQAAVKERNRKIMAAIMASHPSSPAVSRMRMLVNRRDRSEHTIPSSMAFSYDVDDSDGERDRDSNGGGGTDVLDRAFKRCQT